MAGLGIRLFLDEMISWRVAETLRQRGYDVESCKDAKRSAQRIPDYSQLKYAYQEGRAIFTYNRRDFEQLHLEWQKRGWQHPGIIVSDPIFDLNELIDRIQYHLDNVSPSQQANRILELR